MARKIADCREMPSEMNCTLTIAGEEEEVVRAAAAHAADVHGHENTEELREMIRADLKDEVSV
jgi:predicted small metal-binding protein